MEEGEGLCFPQAELAMSRSYGVGEEGPMKSDLARSRSVTAISFLMYIKKEIHLECELIFILTLGFHGPYGPQPPFLFALGRPSG